MAYLTRALLLVVVLAFVATTAFAGDVYVNGTYVAPHWRSAPDSSYNNNWSTYPNVNPYTGQQGTRAPRVEPFGIQPMQPVQPFGSQPVTPNPWGR